MSMVLYMNILWFVLAAIMILSPVGLGSARVWSAAPALMASYTILCIWLIRANNSPGYKFKRTPLDVPIFLLITIAAVSSFFSINRHDSFCALAILAAYVGIYYMIVNEFDHKMVMRVILAVVFAGTVISLYGLMQYMGVLGHSWWDPAEFVAATFVNHNHFAGYLELVISAVFGLLLSEETKKYKLPLAAALVFLLTAFILTQSRGGWMSLLIASVFMMIFAIRRKKTDKNGIFALILVILLISAICFFGKDIISQRMETMLSPLEKQEVSAITRIKIWNGTLDMIKSNPILGSGINTFISGFTAHRDRKSVV